MSPSNSDSASPWKSDQAPCVYCGQVIPRTADRCPHCRTSFSLAVRRASREVVGPWFHLDSRNPSGRGVTFETLIKMIEKGRLRADSIVRGPTTHQDWMYAAETPRLAKYLGLCPHCFAPAKPDETFCTRCQLNMNDRPAKSRPGIPPDLAKAPFHQAAYETEKELAQQPKPEGAPDETGAPATAAATLFAERPTPAPKRPPAAGEKRPRPKLWIVFALTWATLIPLALLTLFTDLPLLFLAGRAEEGFLAWRSSFLGTGNGDRAPPPMLPVTDPWVDGRLKEADQAVADGDLARAIRIYQEVAERTGEATWKARIQDLQRQIAQQEKQRHLDDLRERLKLAEQMASDRRYDDALAVLRNIGAEDRELLATINVSVARMQQTIEDGARRWRAEQEQRQALASRLAEAERLVADGKLAEALALYDRIASEFPARLVREKADLEPIRADLKARIEASAQPPTPPTPPETPPAETVRKLFDEAVALENEGKFAEALGKLEAIKKFDKKSWPENLEEKIKSVTAKKEALEFFGIND